MRGALKIKPTPVGVGFLIFAGQETVLLFMVRIEPLDSWIHNNDNLYNVICIIGVNREEHTV